MDVFGPRVLKEPRSRDVSLPAVTGSRMTINDTGSEGPLGS
jgi:hypothetical protein